MNRQETYDMLAANAVSYASLRNIPVAPIDEPLVPIAHTRNIYARQIGEDMLPITGDQIYVRQTVAQKLGMASLLLADYDDSLSLEVVYGYRALSVQQKLFKNFYGQLRQEYSGDELLEAIHRLIAVPTVAGHPTGGAVDIQITRGKQPLDFGTGIWEFVPDSFTFSPYISETAANNRQLLREVMMTVNFAPFDGEWWHFSYGDREWAYYNDLDNAIFEQLEFNSI